MTVALPALWPEIWALTQVCSIKWKRSALADGELAFPGNGRPAVSELEEEVRALRKELTQVKQDREILKKAAAYFANEKS